MKPPDLPSRSAPRPVVVVLGSGRSGTSLLMQVLAALGMRVSEEMIEARRDNPRGFYEDAPIVRIQADLLRALGAWPFHPLPADWLEAPCTRSAAADLATVLGQRLAGEGLWGFKDPRTATFLPLWRQVFAAMNVTPRFVLALREPGSVIRSFMTAYQADAATAEAVWLARTRDALWHTGAACHIVHYEDWFSRGEAVARRRARFTGLDPARAGALPSGLLRPELDRAGGAGTALSSPPARALEAALAACRGDDFDRSRLLAVVAACRPAPVSSPAASDRGASGPGADHQP